MSKKIILILGIIYVVVTFILYNVLETTIGGILATLSQIAFVVGIIGVIYYIIKFSIKQFIYNRKNRNGIE